MRGKQIMKRKLVQLLMAGAAILLISCDTAKFEALEQKLNEFDDNQKVLLKKMRKLDEINDDNHAVLLKKIDNMDKSIKNIGKSITTLASASKNNKPADNKKQPPKADPNKVYNIPIGDSYTEGPDDAAVTIIEWSDFQ